MFRKISKTSYNTFKIVLTNNSQLIMKCEKYSNLNYIQKHEIWVILVKNIGISHGH